MFKTITPEAAGIESKWVETFLRKMEQRHIPLHSVLMLRGDSIFAEFYWKPFDRDFRHREYSQTKSYVSIAIGLLEEEGKLDLDDKIVSYFPEKIDGPISKYLEAQTIRDMLEMSTSTRMIPYWFTDLDYPDRTRSYFTRGDNNRLSGVFWDYDSAGSQVLCTLVEKLTGMTMLEYLKKKLFNEMGTFQTAQLLKTATEDSWGDSALVCTPRDMASGAYLVMHHGKWEGKQLMNEQYLKDATARQVANPSNNPGFEGCVDHGYGYQIWRLEQNGFAFIGMGSQYSLMLPDKDFILVCNADTQGYESAKDIIINGMFDFIVDHLEPCGKALPENAEAQESLRKYGETLELYHVNGLVHPAMRDKIADHVYDAEENPMGIKSLSFHFEGDDKGEFRYVNAQGEKVLPFGINHNVFCKFPQLGYSNEHGTRPTTNGFMYDCAVSGAWVDENNLELKVQVIDRYFGNAAFIFSFKDDEVFIFMQKNAEAFLDEYQGMAMAKQRKS